MKMVLDKKTAFGLLILFLLLVIAAIGAWFFWGRGTEPEKAVQNKLPSAGFGLGQTFPTATSSPVFITEESEKTPKKDDFSVSFEENAKQVFVSIEELKKQFSPPVSENPIFPLSPAPHATSSVSAFFMSDEKYFVLSYGKEYIKYLEGLQNHFISEGFMSESDRIVFKTEEDAYHFFNIVIDFALNKGYITVEQEKGFKYGVNVVLRNVNKEERPYMEKIINGKSSFRVLIDSAFAFLVEEVYAQEEVTYGDCYRGGVGYGGYNSWSYCCNCGMYCSYGCTYYQDCGYGGASCNVHYGCLNGTCSNRPAIWDQTTGICGCG